MNFQRIPDIFKFFFIFFQKSSDFYVRYIVEISVCRILIIVRGPFLNKDSVVMEV